MTESFLHIVTSNLFSPMILFFLLGVIAGFVKSDLEIPEILAKSLALYLVAAIGLKGGVTLAEHQIDSDLISLFSTVMLVCAFIPLLGYMLLRFTSSLDKLNASVLASHYGSVSLVTFIACSEFLSSLGIMHAGYMVALLALMETPALLSGLYLVRKTSGSSKVTGHLVVLREVFLNGTVVLLIGSLLIGYATGPEQIGKISSFFIDPFKGVLCFFLLDMGLIIGRRTAVLKQIDLTVILYGFYMPLIGASIGYLIAASFALDLSETVILMTLFSSASYIAVPAAMKIAVPQADPTIYVTLPLGITFPFNLVVGIPLYYTAAKHLMGV